LAMKPPMSSISLVTKLPLARGCLYIEGFRSIENKKFLRVRTRTSQDLIYEMKNNERGRLDLHTLVDRTAETFR
jgi:hypothetical protein